MNKLKAITTVYSYRFPEVRKIVTDLTNPFPHRVFLKSVSPAGALDNFHEPIIERVLNFHSASVPRLGDFKYKYPTSGSEEGIREVMTLLQSWGVRRIYILNGEYEGYEAVGKSRCIETIVIDSDTNPKKIEPGYWFISNPSARDGNIIPNQYIEDVCEAGHQVFYDLAYLGSTRQNEFNLAHENIFAAVVSFSKPFGLFYDRIGFTFSRKEVPSLYGNKWFKSILGLLIADKITAELDPAELYKRYRPVQEGIVSRINSELGLELKPSDALLLAHLAKEDAAKLNPEQKEMIAGFQRGKHYRFCLTPYYLECEGEQK